MYVYIVSPGPDQSPFHMAFYLQVRPRNIALPELESSSQLLTAGRQSAGHSPRLQVNSLEEFLPFVFAPRRADRVFLETIKQDGGLRSVSERAFLSRSKEQEHIQ